MLTKLSLSLCLSLTLNGPGAFAATSATTESTGTATPISSGTSINPSAQAGKSSQSSGSAANMAMAAMMMAACMATQPPNMALCMMGAMAAMQGAADKDAADQSAATQTATNTSGATATNAAAKPTFADAAPGTAAFDEQKKIKQGMATLKAAGYTASPAGISSAGGNIAASSFGSSGSMLAAGLDPAAVKEAERIGKDVSSRYSTMSMAADGGGGGGGGSEGGGGGGGGNEASLPALNPYKNPFALATDKKAELMAGKTVQFDGEPIGVKGNDIFQMVHAAYDRKRAGAHFIETDHDPQLGASVRAPASVINPSSVNRPPTLGPSGTPKK